MLRIQTLLLLHMAVFIASASGCGGDRLPVAHVEGKVFYNDQPLKSGGVMFQPAKGPIAKGSIQPDGTFVLSTYREGDGATIGTHKVRIVCYDNKNANTQASEAHEGIKPKSLIPKKYTRAESSGIEVEVTETNEPVIINLYD